MSLVVVNYPAVSREDFDWMRSIRAEHDELYYGVADAHFTFVFPLFGFDRGRFLEHVRERARGVARIPFACRCATVVKDATNEYTHGFLVPDEGHSAIVGLHGRLYEGPLASHLRLDTLHPPHRRGELDRPEGLQADRRRAQPPRVRGQGLHRRPRRGELRGRPGDDDREGAVGRALGPARQSSRDEPRHRGVSTAAEAPTPRPRLPSTATAD